VGRSPFDPAQVLRVELIAYLYDLSERQVEVHINENLPAKFFVELAVDQKAPDHSTLTVFRERLIQRGKLNVFEEMLDELIQGALQSGIQFGSIQLVDSVHGIANVNTDKDRQREKKGKGQRDPDAQWGVKHKRKVKTEHGKEEEQTVQLTFCHPPEENLHRKERRQQTGLAGVERNTRIKQGLKERYKIERKFGEAKQGHGLGRCRYVSMLGFEVQAFMTAIMLNLKRMVKLLTGVGFKTQAASAA